MHDKNLLENLFDSKSLKILRCFIDDKEKQFYLREISKLCAVPVSTTFRIVNKLVEMKVVERIIINKFKLYKLAENDNSAFLIKVLKEKPMAIDYFVNSAKDIVSVDEIILHGKQIKNKASLLLIGGNIDSDKIKLLCSDIKEKHNFVISVLSLTRIQFEQMSSMDLFPREKKVLYRR